MQGQGRAASATRQNSIEQRHSAERRHSMDERHSAERRTSAERRPKPFGPTAQMTPQVSQFWQHELPSGETAQVWFVADGGYLTQAVYQLSCLKPDTVTAVDMRGLNLSAGGTLCLVQVAFRAGTNLNCFLFDILQLGVSFQAVMPFLQNGQISKLMYDAPTHAKILAQQFGITLAGVFHAETAYEMLAVKQPVSMVDLLQWCGKASSVLKAEALMMERAPELWSHRPLAEDTLAFAINAVCILHAAGYVLWYRLCNKLGQSTAQMALQVSEQRAQAAAAAGWAVRQAGVHQDRYDPELDKWIAQRQGLQAGTLSGAPQPYAPSPAVRAGDSPRTASWRATVAQMQSRPSTELGSRQRSSSPTLQSWLERRSAARRSDDHKVHRASSLPPPKSTFVGGGAAVPSMSPTLTAGIEPFRLGFHLDSLASDGRTWAEILEEEQAREAEKDSEEDLFKQLQQEEQRRLVQAELS